MTEQFTYAELYAREKQRNRELWQQLEQAAPASGERGAMADVLGDWVRNTTGVALTHVTLVGIVRVMLTATSTSDVPDGGSAHE